MRSIEIVWAPNRDLVAGLAQGGARFFVVGSTATRFHVPDRDEPNDLDLMVEPSEEMFVTLRAVMARVGAPSIMATSEQFTRGNGHLREHSVLNVDILTPPPGFDFAAHWAAADDATMNLTEVRVRVASIAALEWLLRLAQEREPAKAAKCVKDLELLAKAAERL